MSPSKTKLTAWFPQAQSPIIISAPMLGVSNGTLSAHVSQAGGIGIVPGGYDFNPGKPQLDALAVELDAVRTVLGAPPHLPVGVGYILSQPSVLHFEAAALPLLQRYGVPVAWLFAPDPAPTTLPDPDTTPQRRVIASLRRAGIAALVQVGTVAAARQAVEDGADGIVAQGVDAGGHQFAQGAGVISLVPEVRTMLDDEFADREVVLVAAGGIADGRGVAAALALGADGVVMGTRFIAAQESSAPAHQRKVILETRDGASNTIKATFHDEIRGSLHLWPALYDGRAVIGSSYQDHASGLSLEDNLIKFKEAQAAGDTSRMVTWAGTGVGLVRKELSAVDIVTETREEARRTIRALQAFAST